MGSKILAGGLVVVVVVAMAALMRGVVLDARYRGAHKALSWVRCYQAHGRCPKCDSIEQNLWDYLHIDTTVIK